MTTENQKKRNREYWLRKNSKVKWYRWRKPRKHSADDYRRPTERGDPQEVRVAEGFVFSKRLSTKCTLCGRTGRLLADRKTLDHPVDWYPKDRSDRALPAQVKAGWSIEALKQEMERCDPYCWTCWQKVVK